MLEIYVIFYIIFNTYFQLYFKKKQFLIDKKFNLHKSFATKSVVPITGGFTFLTSSLFFKF